MSPFVPLFRRRPPTSCRCLFPQLLSGSAASAVFQTSPPSINIRAELILTGCRSDCFFLFLFFFVLDCTLSESINSTFTFDAGPQCTPTPEHGLYVWQGVIQGGCVHESLAHTSFNPRCIAGPLNMSSPQRVSGFMAATSSTFSPSTLLPVKVPFVKNVE